MVLTKIKDLFEKADSFLRELISYSSNSEISDSPTLQIKESPLQTIIEIGDLLVKSDLNNINEIKSIIKGKHFSYKSIENNAIESSFNILFMKKSEDILTHTILGFFCDFIEKFIKKEQFDLDVSFIDENISAIFIENINKHIVCNLGSNVFSNIKIENYKIYVKDIKFDKKDKILPEIETTTFFKEDDLVNENESSELVIVFINNEKFELKNKEIFILKENKNINEPMLLNKKESCFDIGAGVIIDSSSALKFEYLFKITINDLKDCFKIFNGDKNIKITKNITKNSYESMNASQRLLLSSHILQIDEIVTYSSPIKITIDDSNFYLSYHEEIKNENIPIKLISHINHCVYSLSKENNTIVLKEVIFKGKEENLYFYNYSLTEEKYKLSISIAETDNYDNVHGKIILYFDQEKHLIIGRKEISDFFDPKKINDIEIFCVKKKEKTKLSGIENLEEYYIMILDAPEFSIPNSVNEFSFSSNQSLLYKENNNVKYLNNSLVSIQYFENSTFSELGKGLSVESNNKDFFIRINEEKNLDIILSVDDIYSNLNHESIGDVYLNENQKANDIYLGKLLKSIDYNNLNLQYQYMKYNITSSDFKEESYKQKNDSSNTFYYDTQENPALYDINIALVKNNSLRFHIDPEIIVLKDYTFKFNKNVIFGRKENEIEFNVGEESIDIIRNSYEKDDFNVLLLDLITKNIGISKKQAELTFKENKFYFKNLGQNNEHIFIDYKVANRSSISIYVVTFSDYIKNKFIQDELIDITESNVYFKIGYNHFIRLKFKVSKNDTKTVFLTPPIRRSKNVKRV
ncbi:MAG: hypothetical protein AABZ74_01860 [Cyanobacteriota bacterium]